MRRSTRFNHPEFVRTHLDLDVADLDRSSIEKQTRVLAASNRGVQDVGVCLGNEEGSILGVDDRRRSRWSGPTHGDRRIDFPRAPGPW